MRPSPLRHPLAVLRQTIGLTQQELAQAVGRPVRTIQAVELLHMKLSEELAQDIANFTGVDAGWLLEGDPKTLPRKGLIAAALSPRPLTRDLFLSYRLLVGTRGAAEVQQGRSGSLPSDLAINPVTSLMDAVDRNLQLAVKQLLEQSRDGEHGQSVRSVLHRVVLDLAKRASVQLAAPAVATAPNPMLPKGKIARMAYETDGFRFMTPAGWHEHQDHTGLTLEGPDRARFDIMVNEVSRSVLDVEAENPESSVFVNRLKATEPPSPNVTVPLHLDTRARIPCWTLVCHDSDGMERRMVIQSVFRNGSRILVAVFRAPRTEPWVLEHDRFVRSVEPVTPEERAAAAAAQGSADVAVTE